ncbi:MAG: glycoside hydrolase family 43 protein [Spirochaetales bacterium]|nr:glycoside hydrolase family 43 protein [Spirochaetales bacterium]
MEQKIINPIMPGFNPDPSICVVDDTFYLVNSTFSYFPGIPVYKSKDCTNWEQIGNVIHRRNQLDFTGEASSRGLFAPTIRYNKGTFYCICTQVDKIGNFFMTAQKPEGPWSDPIVIKGADGIDPSLFFDDDGTVWYIGQHFNPAGVRWNGDCKIWIQRIDINSGRLYGKKTDIWSGALKKCVWPEGPHIYKKDGWYYLIHAEGGTSVEHAVSVARCKTMEGEWEGKKANPILTHRQLGLTAGVINVGHADLFCSKEGNWRMVCLGSRPYGDGELGGGRCCNMGRETFLVPVHWEDDWPVVARETGLIERAYTQDGFVAKTTLEDDKPKPPVIDKFDEDTLAPYWMTLRNRNPDLITLFDNPGCLRLYGNGKLTSTDEVSFVAERQTAFSFEASAKMKATLKEEGDAAGITCFQSEEFHYCLELCRKDGKNIVQLVKVTGGNAEVVADSGASAVPEDAEIELKAEARMQNLFFSFSINGARFMQLGDAQDATILSTEKAGGFIGTVVGMFAESTKPQAKTCYADFDEFIYKNTTNAWIDPYHF